MWTGYHWKDLNMDVVDRCVYGEPKASLNQVDAPLSFTGCNIQEYDMPRGSQWRAKLTQQTASLAEVKLFVCV